VAPEAEIVSVLIFVDDLVATAGPDAGAAIIRVPNRRDLSAVDAIRLRTDAGAVLVPGSSPVPPPGADGWRTVVVTEPGQAGDVKRLWAAALSVDGVPSALAGPWTLRWPPAPLEAPALTATASASSVDFAWTWAVTASGLVAVERLVDGAWRRVSPMFTEATTSWSGQRPVGPVRYRLRVAGLDGRSAFSNEVTLQ
jgi:hypothetical protein